MATSVLVPGVLALAAMAGMLDLAAQRHASSDEEAVREVVRAYVVAREARDEAAIAALFTQDVDQLVSSGEWRRSREGVVAGALGSSARTGGRRVITVETVRLIGADTAIADGRYEILEQQDGSTRQMWTTFVMARQPGGQWKIAAIRNMLPAPPGG
jgi:uncharacterized protein (TIGR02246 family)